MTRMGAAVDFFKTLNNRQVRRRGEDGEGQGRARSDRESRRDLTRPWHTARSSLPRCPLRRRTNPSLALGLLKAAVAGLGVGCDGPLLLARLCRAGRRRGLRDPRRQPTITRRWSASGCSPARASGDPDAEDLGYLTEAFRRDFPEHYTPATPDDLPVGAAGGGGVHRALSSPRSDWQDYAIVGFTSSFQQNLASLAPGAGVRSSSSRISASSSAARTARARWGSSCNRRYGFIDAVCLGEGRCRPFPSWCAVNRAGADLDGIAGLVTRRGGRHTVVPAQALAAVEDMDRPALSRSRRFLRAARSRAGSRRRTIPTAVVLETSRGCWWGGEAPLHLLRHQRPRHGLSQQVPRRAPMTS